MTGVEPLRKELSQCCSRWDERGTTAYLVQAAGMETVFACSAWLFGERSIHDADDALP